MSVLEDYSSKCSADFTDLKLAHIEAHQADTAAHTQLQESWGAVEHELGLLVSRIADSNGFIQLARLDAASADFEANRAAICGQGKSAEQAALLAVDRSFSEGFAKQTWTQLVEVFDEMDMLRTRFYPARLKTPSNQTLLQAWDRAANALDDSWERRSDIAREGARRACGQESAHVGTPSVVMEEQLKVKDAQLTAKDKAMEEQLKAKDAVLLETKANDAELLKAKDTVLLETKANDAELLKAKDAELKAKDAGLKAKDAELKAKDALLNELLKGKDAKLEAKDKEAGKEMLLQRP